MPSPARSLGLALLVALLLGGGTTPLPAQDKGPGGDLGGGAGGIGDGGIGGDPGDKPNDEKKPLPIRVNQAIDSGVKWLSGLNTVGEKVFISAAGNWSDEVRGSVKYDPNSKGDEYVHPTGCTSLALYALLKSGVPKDDPLIKKGFAWLRGGSASMTKGSGKSTSKGKTISNRIPGGTYEIATLMLALEAKANPHKLEAQRERDLKFKLKRGEKLKLDVKLDAEDQPWMAELQAALMKRWNKQKGWRYGFFNGTGLDNQAVRGDNDLSATNLSMLAFVAAERCGFSQPDDFYAGVLKWTLTMQQKEGEEVVRWEPKSNAEDARYAVTKDHARGFGYLGANAVPAGGRDDEHKPTGSMTMCGLANIVICTSILEARESKAYTPELEGQAEKAWWDGVAFMDSHWSVSDNVNKGGYHYYYLYCLERACDMKRIHLLAGHPWYDEGALVLVNDQNWANSGAWTKDDTHKPSSLLNTCFALLFLNRATPAITGGD